MHTRWSMWRARRRPIVTAALLTLMAADLASAQMGNLGSLTGFVHDANGGAVAAARVRLRHRETGREQEAATTADGRYTFARLPPGLYVLDVTRPGFHAARLTDIAVSVNEAARTDIALQVGVTETIVTVSGATRTLQTQSTEQATLVAGRSVSELPINGREFSRVINLAPGVGSYNSPGGTLPTPAISGARHSYNTFSIDGLGNNDERSSDGLASGGGAAAFDRTAAPNVISTEAIQEVRIITSNADATFGRSSGGQISIVTKSGTNEYRGSAYHSVRDAALDARDFFNNGPFFDGQGRAVVPPFHQQLYGGTLGGPLPGGRHFFFGSYEGFRQRLQQTGSYVAPNPDLIGLMPGDLQRVFRTFFVDRGSVTGTTSPGEFRPLTPTDRQAAVAAGFPAHLFDGTPDNGEAGTLLLSLASTRDVDQHALLVRTDHVLSTRLRASARVGYARPTQTTAIGLPIDLRRDERRWTSAVGEMVAVLSPRQVLEVRGGVLRPTFSQRPAHGVDARFTDLGIRESVGLAITAPGSGLSDVTVFGTNGFLDHQLVPQVQVQHTWTRGAWMLRTGADLSYQRIDIHNGAGRPLYSFQGFSGPHGLLGAAPGQDTAMAAAASASIFGASGGPTSALRHFETSRHEVFLQSDWRVRPDLTLNLGLRYANFGVYNELDGAIANLYAIDPHGRAVPGASPFAFGRTANAVLPIADDRPLYARDTNNVEPRVGLAWNVGARGRMVLRAAYGLYHDRLFQLLFSSGGGLVNNPPFTIASSAADVPFQSGGSLPVVPGIPAVTGVNPGIENPSTHRVTAGIERDLGARTTVAATYVGSFGRGLFGIAEINGGSALPQSLRPDQRFSVQRILDNTSWSDYHALQMTFNRRVSRGLMVTAAYTLADSKDDSSAETSATFPAIANRRATRAAGYAEGAEFVDRPRAADWGPSDFLSRQVLAIGWLVDLPFGREQRFIRQAGPVWQALVGGWRLSGIVAARSGERIDLRLGTDANKDGDVRDRPSLLSDSLDDLYARGADKTQYLVPRADAIARLGPSASPGDPFSVVPRNALSGPGFVNVDLSLLKQSRVAGRLQIRVELNVFNVFNRTHLGNPIASLSDARFGRIVSTAPGTTPRQLQLGVKLFF